MVLGRTGREAFDMRERLSLEPSSALDESDGQELLLERIESALERRDLDEALRLVRSGRQRCVRSVPPTMLPGFTGRELAALALLPDATMSQKDMARVLGISHNTLKTHMRSLYRKLGAHCRAEAIERSRMLEGRS